MGAPRRWLKRLGPTWLSSPWRRAAQALCLALFLWLFFYSCWPYRAQPAPVWKGWIPTEIDTETGLAWVTSESGLDGSIRAQDRVHISDESVAGQKPSDLGPFVVQRIKLGASPNENRSNRSEQAHSVKSEIRIPKSETDGRKSASPPSRRATVELQIRPEHKMTAEALEKLSVSAGPWVISPQPPNQWPSHYADDFAARDRIPVEMFLLIDPLVSLSTALAAKAWMWSLWGAALILALGVFIPRGFCGYLCPLGTLIDLFDWAIAGRVKRFRVADNGWWVHLKYYLLFGVLVAAFCGVLLSGFVSAIPVLTRGLMFLVAPGQLGSLRGWHQVPALNPGQWFSILLFLAVLGLGFLRPRFWCKYVCPSGAVFSVGNLFRVSERKVEDTCIHCNKCVEICPFDAIKPDFTTRVTDCTLCQTCGGVCPTHAIKFVERSNRVALKLENDPPTGEHSVAGAVARLASSISNFRFRIPNSCLAPMRWLLRLLEPAAPTRGRAPFAEARIGRRSFLAGGIGVLAGLAGGFGSAWATKSGGARLDDPARPRPVRPPGSVPEKEFLELCIRCGECFKVCPNNVLQPLGFQQGIEGLWTPQVVADWAGCEPSCNACGQACPTGAIRPLPLAEKKAARMGLAVVNPKTCLPLAGREPCQLCVDECTAAGYNAIEFIRVHTQSDDSGQPIEGTGFLAPQVQAGKCVGCGLCQTHCYSINVKTKKLIARSAIIVEAGAGKEDRMMRGSYLALRSPTQQRPSAAANSSSTNAPRSFLPEFLNSPPPPPGPRP